MSIQRLTPTRRQFTLGLAGAALAFPGTRNSVYNPMLAAHTGVWRGEMMARKKHPADIVDEALAATKRAGYGRVQLIEEFLSPPVRERTLARLKSLGLELSIVCAGGRLHTRTDAEATRAQVSVDAGSLMGSSEYVGFRIAPHPDGKPKTSEELRMQAIQLNLLGQEVAHAGMRLILDHEDAEMQNDAREWRYMLANTESPTVGFCVDVDCAVRAGVNPWALIDTAGGRLRSLHLRNTRQGRTQEVLREGDIDMGQIASLLRAMQYDGFLVVELAYDASRERQHSVANALALSRAYAHMVFGNRPGAPPVDMGPHIRIPR